MEHFVQTTSKKQPFKLRFKASSFFGKNETIENSNFLFNLNIFNLSFDYIEQFNKQFYYFIWQPLLYNSRRNSKYIFNLIIMVPFGKLNTPNCFSYYCHLLE